MSLGIVAFALLFVAFDAADPILLFLIFEPFREGPLAFFLGKDAVEVPCLVDADDRRLLLLVVLVMMVTAAARGGVTQEQGAAERKAEVDAGARRDKAGRTME